VGASLAEERQVALGNDDRTGQPVTIILGRALPSILTTSAELGRWREALFGEKRRRGAVYSWNHPTVGPLAMAKKADAAALGRIYAVEGPAVRPAAVSAPGGISAISERWAEISGYPQRVATHLAESAKQLNPERFQAANPWEKSALPLGIIGLYELVQDSGAVSPELDGRIRQALKAWLALLLADPTLRSTHNMGSALQPAAWAIAVLLQDQEALRRLFAVFKAFLGTGTLEGGSYYEGTSYASMAAADLRQVAAIAQRNGADLTHVACEPKPLESGFRQTQGFRTLADFLFFAYRAVAPDLRSPLIHDGSQTPYPNVSTGGARADYALTGEDRFASFAKWLEFDRKEGDPNEVWALLPEYPKETTPPLERLPEVGEPDGGVFVFREGTGLDPASQYVLLLNTPKAGFHAHDAFGHFSVFRWGRSLTSDQQSSAKSTGYQPLRDQLSAPRWGHNTVVINGEWGKSHDMGLVRYCWLQHPEAAAKAVDLELGDASQKVKASHRRQFVVLPECILIADTLVSDSPVSFDWWVHGERKGTADFDGQTSPAENGFPGYLEPGLVTMTRKAVLKAGETFDMALAGEPRTGIRYTLLSPSKLDLYLGTGVSPRHGADGVYPEEPTPCAVLRHPVGSAASFLVMAEPYREKSAVRSARATRHKGPRWRAKIQLLDRTWRVVTADGKGFRLESR
jgi:hypothetical protein